MAEIKSTMDLVMERAARIGKASSEDLQREEAHKQGMQLTAGYLEGTMAGLAEALGSVNKEMQQEIRTGMLESLLRNIFLPRNDIQRERAEKAGLGIVDLAGGARDISTTCQGLMQIIQGYIKHRDELRGQLEEQIKMQYKQLLEQQGGVRSEELSNIDPTLQPKFQEQWGKLEAELNSRYGEALEQHKASLKQLLGL
ncbi:MAG: DUF6657 family protein [Desulfobulbaceae bacterium]|nr:DUF6657 family protein [Desulfobulbaceae bacterium]